jgi:hypothetical protein
MASGSVKSAARIVITKTQSHAVTSGQTSWFAFNTAPPSTDYIATVSSDNPNVVCGIAIYDGSFCCTYTANGTDTYNFTLKVVKFKYD